MQECCSPAGKLLQQETGLASATLPAAKVQLPLHQCGEQMGSNTQQKTWQPNGA